MNLITSTIINNLCSEHPREMQGLLPELVKRLIICSSKNLTSIRIPGKEDIWAPGFDGVVECNEASTYVIVGKSVWEFGTNDATLKKIESDYQKRTQDSLGLDIKDTAFYLVTPRIWTFDNQGHSITKWEAEHTDWKSVRVYDASVLSDWINSCPEIAAWLLEQFYSKKICFSTLSVAWSRLSKYTSPALSPNMFINGRTDEKNLLFDLVKKQSIIKLKSKTQIDAFGFCIVTLMEDKELANRIIVVETEDAYKSLSTECKGKIFLLKPMEISEFIDGNTTIVCYSKEATSIQPDIKLAPMRKKQFVDAIKEMGIPETEIDSLYYHTHGELFALIRRIPGNSNILNPEWADKNNNKLLYPLLFLRAINVNDPTSQKICEALSGTSFNSLLDAYDDYLRLEDSPIKKIENVYSMVSCEETWQVLSPDVNGAEFTRLAQTLLLILDICSGKTKDILQLGGASCRFFYSLSLSFLLYSYDNTENCLLCQQAKIILGDLWENEEFYNSLRLYAEACPEIVMNHFTADYYSESSRIKHIFSDGGYASHYTDILHALEHLTSVDATKVASCKLLFLLCSIQTQYYYSTTPMETLLNVLWFYNTEGELKLSDKVKLALKFLDDDIIGTKLVYELIIKTSAYKSVRIGSKKKGSYGITRSELIDAIRNVARALIEKIVERKDQKIVVNLINHFWSLPPDMLLLLLNNIHTADFQLTDWIEICYTIRHKERWYKANKEEQYHAYIKVFEDFITKIDSQEEENYALCALYGSVYDYDMIKILPVDAPDTDYDESEKYAKQKRKELLDTLFDKEGANILSILLRIMNDDTEWGRVLAQSKFQGLGQEVCEAAKLENRYSIIGGFLDDIDANLAYKMILSFTQKEQEIIIPRIYNKKVAALITEERLQALFWSNKIMRDYSESEFHLLLKYNPNGLLPYFVYLNPSRVLDGKSTIVKILTTIISMNKTNGYEYGQHKDAFERIFSIWDNDGYYNDEYAEMCLYLSKYNYGYRLHECAKLFYYHHPERICFIIKTGKDDYINAVELLMRYEYPHSVIGNYDDLNVFIQAIICGVDNEHLSTVKRFIGLITAKGLKEFEKTGKADILRKIVENYHSNDFDSGFIDGYMEWFRTIGDGSDQEKESSRLRSEASNIEFDYPHTASLLRIIAGNHSDLAKHDYVLSELGDIT